MKKIIYLFLLMIAIGFIACKKESPKIDYVKSIGNGSGTIYYTNNYILNEINAEIQSDDTINKDTVNYNELFININLKGYLIAENHYTYEYPDGSGLPSVEQKYFINKIVSFDVIPNVKYNNDSINSFYKILCRNKYGEYFENPNLLYNSKLGYSPLRIYLTQAPDTSKMVSFTIRIKDNKENVYTAKTDSVYVIK